MLWRECFKLSTGLKALAERVAASWCCLTAVSIVVVLSAHASAATLVPKGAQWTYLNPLFGVDPAVADPDFNTTWFTPGFDDSSWQGPSPSPFAWGRVSAIDPPATELLDPGSGNRYASYFRHEFTTRQEATNLAMNLVVDDGAVFYLDGQEITRLNCCEDDAGDPGGPDGFTNLATGSGDERNFSTVEFPLSQPLAPGNHVLGVSVHNSSANGNDLGFDLSLQSGLVFVREGIDTTMFVSSGTNDNNPDGVRGPDVPAGAAGLHPDDDGNRWEWDLEDGDLGEPNYGLLWFDVPQDILTGFEGTATMRFHVTNDGDSGDVYRVTEDWLSGPDGGDNMAFDFMPPFGLGISIGDNTTQDPSFSTGALQTNQNVEFDVTADVLAWAAGEPNYGWTFVPTGGNGAVIASFESPDRPTPELILIPKEEEPPPAELQAGDSNQDLKFDQVDLVQVQIAAKYLTGDAATWGQGDWDGAPGGSVGSPPAGDGQFNQRDIVASQIAGTYLTGPYAAVEPGGVEGDGQTSIKYFPATGEVAVDAPAGVELTSINIDSAASIFTGEAAQNLGGSFDNDADNNIFKATFGSSFGSLSFGNVAQAGLSQDAVLADLTVIGSLAGGGDLGAVDLIYVPEPSTIRLLGLGLVALIGLARRRSN